MPAAEPVLQIRVRCTELPGRRFVDATNLAKTCYEPVHLGIQRGKEVIQRVPADRREASFLAEFRVAEQKDGSPNFLGPYAQGTVDDRFFYLSWGVKRASGSFEMFRRLKIRLGHLKWPEIRRSIQSKKPIEVTLRLTDARGAPLCATPPATHLRWQGG